jgi:hypothetical protein
VVCLIYVTDEDVVYDRRFSFLPYDYVALSEEQEATVVDLMADATNETVCALMESAFSSRGTMPDSVTNHLREAIVDAIPNFQASTSGVVLSEAIRPRLGPDLVRELVDHNELQTLLKEDEDLSSLICGLVRMNKSGRNYFLEDSGDILQGLFVLESVSYNFDCLFIHLRENSMALCNR